MYRQASSTVLRNVRDLTTDEVTAILRPILRRVSKNLTAADFLADAASNGLFIERANGGHAFATWSARSVTSGGTRPRCCMSPGPTPGQSWRHA